MIVQVFVAQPWRRRASWVCASRCVCVCVCARVWSSPRGQFHVSHRISDYPHARVCDYKTTKHGQGLPHGRGWRYCHRKPATPNALHLPLQHQMAKGEVEKWRMVNGKGRPLSPPHLDQTAATGEHCNLSYPQSSPGRRGSQADQKGNKYACRSERQDSRVTREGFPRHVRTSTSGPPLARSSLL